MRAARAKHANDWEKYRSQLTALERLEFNYDAKVYQESADKLGWNVDKYHARLGHELPGPPVPNGPFDRVRDAVRLYQFPDPRLITALFDPEGSLAGRNMLLRARFLGFTFYFGVRVTAVIDEERTNEAGQRQRFWGYSYRTLKGHFEVGEIRFEVEKNLATGDVIFHVEAYSRPDRIPQPLFRLGFKIFGRTLQRYFARSSIARLQEIAAQKNSEK